MFNFIKNLSTCFTRAVKNMFLNILKYFKCQLLDQFTVDIFIIFFYWSHSNIYMLVR